MYIPASGITLKRSLFFLVFLFISSCGGGGGGGGGNDSSLASKNHIEALFFGSGPLAEDNNGCTRSEWLGFTRGTILTVTVPDTLPQLAQDAISSFASDVPALTNGAIDAEFRLTLDDNPLPSENEVTVSLLPSDDVAQACSRPNALGCALLSLQGGSASILHSAQVIVVQNASANVYRHELAHAILGLCHIVGANSMMTVNRSSNFTTSNFSDLDTAAIMTVFQSSLSPGATREEFVLAEIINP